ncbi:MAG: nitroreductase family protein [Treponema sp.]|nr:nitroreductase family protein [Treponema sp.]
MLGRIKALLINNEKKMFSIYSKRFFRNSFVDGKCKTEKQYEASITRFYHTVEKGLSYLNYRPGFGRENINILISEMEEYSKKFDIEKFFYKTALSTLFEYVKKNKENGFTDEDLEKRVNNLTGEKNNEGGCLEFNPVKNASNVNYEELIKNRHSMRHFSQEPLKLENVIKAVDLAQYTPSACNRQGWHTYIINDKNIMKQVLDNQNGNRGFGQEFDKLLVVVGDLQYFNRDREIFQVYIDGGMYAMRILDSLQYYGIASCPLSASLNQKQERNVRNILNIPESDVLIMFIGVGNYPECCITTRSERHQPYSVIL